MNPQINNIIKQYIVFEETFLHIIKPISHAQGKKVVHVPYRNSMMTMGMSNILSHFQHMLFNMFLCMRGESTAPIHHQAWWKAIDGFCVVSMCACVVLKDSLGGNCRTRMLATVGQRVHSSQYHFWCCLSVNFTLYFHPSMLFLVVREAYVILYLTPFLSFPRASLLATAQRRHAALEWDNRHLSVCTLRRHGQERRQRQVGLFAICIRIWTWRAGNLVHVG